jgi:hypothetical protein
MARRDYTDLIGGGVLVATGLATAIYALLHYDPGSLSRMGPGFFPAALGFVLALLGLLVLLPALRRAGDWPVPHFRPFFTILLSLAAFALTVRAVGMVPATFILVGIAAFAQHEVRLLPTFALGGALAAIAVLIFAQGLGVVLPAFAWPFAS